MLVSDSHSLSSQGILLPVVVDSVPQVQNLPHSAPGSGRFGYGRNKKKDPKKIRVVVMISGDKFYSPIIAVSDIHVKAKILAPESDSEILPSVKIVLK